MSIFCHFRDGKCCSAYRLPLISPTKRSPSPGWGNHGQAGSGCSTCCSDTAREQPHPGYPTSLHRLMWTALLAQDPSNCAGSGTSYCGPQRRDKNETPPPVLTLLTKHWILLLVKVVRAISSHISIFHLVKNPYLQTFFFLKQENPTHNCTCKNLLYSSARLWWGLGVFLCFTSSVICDTSQIGLQLVSWLLKLPFLSEAERHYFNPHSSSKEIAAWKTSLSVFTLVKSSHRNSESSPSSNWLFPGQTIHLPSQDYPLDKHHRVGDVYRRAQLRGQKPKPEDIQARAGCTECTAQPLVISCEQARTNQLLLQLTLFKLQHFPTTSTAPWHFKRTLHTSNSSWMCCSYVRNIVSLGKTGWAAGKTWPIVCFTSVEGYCRTLNWVSIALYFKHILKLVTTWNCCFLFSRFICLIAKK